MAKKPAKEKDERTEAEAAKVRDQTLKMMLGTKPKPHKVDSAKKK